MKKSLQLLNKAGDFPFFLRNYKLLVLWCFVGAMLLAGAALAAQPDRPQAPAAAGHCPALPAPGGHIVHVSTVNELVDAVNGASSGDTILLADGNYALNGAYLRVDTPNVSVRSASGNREAVILDGNYQTTEIFQVVASNVTIADMTLREAYDHPIHIVTGENSHNLNALIYNVHIIDPGQQAIKINPASDGYYNDNGVIACSHLELTTAGRVAVWERNGSCYTGGVDMHQGRGWVIRDNLIEGFWCAQGLSEHGIHLWRGCRDTIIERNVLNDNARGIGLGLVTSGSGRTYPDNPCPSASGYVDDFGGVIRNNFISGNDPGLLASESHFDCGICLANACNAEVLHNTVYTADPDTTFSSIEWRFPNTQALITNNLVNDTMREREGASAVQSGNISEAAANWFVDAASGDLHLASTATEALNRVTAPANVSDDVDGDPRPLGSASDVGADEYGDPPPAAVRDVRIGEVITAGEAITITLTWTAPAGAESQAIRYANVPIHEANWASATLLSDSLAGSAGAYTAVLPYSGGELYFAQRAYNTAGGWSEVSNNVFWPRSETYLPAILR
ncbi:MAG: hypothetical protein ACOYYS_13655 [Chloroflexota bacterium]